MCRFPPLSILPSQFGYTPAHVACVKGHTDCLAALIAAGGAVNAVDTVRERDTEMHRLVLCAGCDCWLHGCTCQLGCRQAAPGSPDPLECASRCFGGVGRSTCSRMVQTYRHRFTNALTNVLHGYMLRLQFLRVVDWSSSFLFPHCLVQSTYQCLSTILLQWILDTDTIQTRCISVVT